MPPGVVDAAAARLADPGEVGTVPVDGGAGLEELAEALPPEELEEPAPLALPDALPTVAEEQDDPLLLPTPELEAPAPFASPDALPAVDEEEDHPLLLPA